MSPEKSILVGEFSDDEDPSRGKYLHSVTFLRKLLLLLGVVCLTLCIVLIAVAAHDDDDDDDDDRDNTLSQLECTTPSCVTTSAYILNSMNQSVEPCQNFYQYACGGWISNSKAPASSAKWDRFREVALRNSHSIRSLVEAEGTLFRGKNSTAVAKLKSYYRTCMDTAKVEEQGASRMLQAIDKLGSWTVTNNDITAWDRSTWSLQQSLVATHSLLRSALFGFKLSADAKDNTKTVITFSQSGLTLSHEGEYTEENATKFKDAFMTFASDVGVLLGGKKDIVKEKMSKVYQFEKKLAQIFVPRENLTDPPALYNKMTIGEFQDLIGQWIDIKGYLISIFKSRAFNNDDTVIVTVPEYFKALGPLVESTDKEVLANYIMWNFVNSLTGYLSDAFAEAALGLARVESGLTQLPDRWERCLGKAELAVGFASSALYVEEFFSPDSKAKVTEMTKEVREAFVENLDSVSWMDDQTRQRLKVKAEAMTEMVGYPDWLLDLTKLDEYYEKLTVKEGEFLENKINSVTYINNRELNKYGKPPDRHEWYMLPSMVNAYYDPEFNVIVVPAGILQPPFFQPEFPDSYMYGTIGMILGHELSHGFDNTGRHFDEHGNMADMWTAHSVKAFHEKTQCMIDQYDDYLVQGYHVKGLLTLGENIADNGGLASAYHAYKRKSANSEHKETHLPALGVTDEQLYFLGFTQIWCAKIKPEYEIQALATDPHSTPSIRIRGTLQNSEDFFKVYKCDSSSTYDSQDRCNVW